MTARILRNHKPSSHRRLVTPRALYSALRNCIFGAGFKQGGRQASTCNLPPKRWKGEPTDLRRTLLTAMAGVDAIEVELLGLVEAANSPVLISAEKAAAKSHQALMEEHHNTSVLDIMEILNVVAILNPRIRGSGPTATMSTMVLEKREGKDDAHLPNFKLPILAMGLHHLISAIRLPFLS